MGNIDNVRVVLKKEGCEVIKNSLDEKCDFSCKDGFVLYPATILSRLGKEYLIDIGTVSPVTDSDKNNLNINKRVVIKDEQVMGWSKNYVNVVNGKR